MHLHTLSVQFAGYKLIFMYFKINIFSIIFTECLLQLLFILSTFSLCFVYCTPGCCLFVTGGQQVYCNHVTAVGWKYACSMTEAAFHLLANCRPKHGVFACSIT